MKQQLSYVRAVGVRQEIQISIISRKMTWKSPTVTLIIKTEKIMIKIKLLIIYPNSLFHCYVFNWNSKYDLKELTSLLQKCHFSMSFILKFEFLLLSFAKSKSPWLVTTLSVCVWSGVREQNLSAFYSLYSWEHGH